MGGILQWFMQPSLAPAHVLLLLFLIAGALFLVNRKNKPKQSLVARQQSVTSLHANVNKQTTSDTSEETLFAPPSLAKQFSQKFLSTIGLTEDASPLKPLRPVSADMVEMAARVERRSQMFEVSMAAVTKTEPGSRHEHDAGWGKWKDADYKSLNLRGKTYAADKKKVPAGIPMLDLLHVDYWSRPDKCMDASQVEQSWIYTMLHTRGVPDGHTAEGRRQYNLNKAACNGSNKVQPKGQVGMDDQPVKIISPEKKHEEMIKKGPAPSDMDLMSALTMAEQESDSSNNKKKTTTATSTTAHGKADVALPPLRNSAVGKTLSIPHKHKNKEEERGRGRDTEGSSPRRRSRSPDVGFVESVQNARAALMKEVAKGSKVIAQVAHSPMATVRNMVGEKELPSVSPREFGRRKSLGDPASDGVDLFKRKHRFSRPPPLEKVPSPDNNDNSSSPAHKTTASSRNQKPTTSFTVSPPLSLSVSPPSAPSSTCTTSTASAASDFNFPGDQENGRHWEDTLHLPSARFTEWDATFPYAFIFVVNFVVPDGDNWWNVVIYLGLRKEHLKLSSTPNNDAAGTEPVKEQQGMAWPEPPPASPAKFVCNSGEDVSGFITMLNSYLSKDGEFRDACLKLIPQVIEGSWMVRKAVGTTPAIVGKKLTQSYTGNGRTYLETVIDVGSSQIGSSILGMVKSYASNLTIDLSFTLQGKQEDELPERLLGGLRLSGLNLFQIPPLDSL
eukprot:gb/GEZN01002392.1/.p1 GENE.gb/GEZN01002392.1/~~gb/GEZN01002392.1/.p1  ORF type:complete len:729 (-),score=113.56 gb/GEZN01002392.1/:136-2322(-)